MDQVLKCSVVDELIIAELVVDELCLDGERLGGRRSVREKVTPKFL